MKDETPWTPGPWVAFYKRKYDEWHVAVPVEGSNFKWALAPDGINSPNREADARLIAAAPEMAELLRQLAPLLEDVVHDKAADIQEGGSPEFSPIELACSNALGLLAKIGTPA